MVTKVQTLFIISLLFVFAINFTSAISWNSGSSIGLNIGASNLTDLGDVNATAPTDGQALVWNSTTARWEAQNQTGTGGGGGGSIIWERNGTIISPINDGDDLNITGDILIENNVSSLRPHNDLNVRVFF